MPCEMIGVAGYTGGTWKDPSVGTAHFVGDTRAVDGALVSYQN